MKVMFYLLGMILGSKFLTYPLLMSNLPYIRLCRSVLHSDSDVLCREFVGCVRCIRILSPTEVQQMSEEGMKLLNSGALQGINV